MRISDRVQAMQNSPIRKFNPMAEVFQQSAEMRPVAYA